MDSVLEDVGRCLLQVLYENYDSGKHYSSTSLSTALDIPESKVQVSLDKLVEVELINESDEGYRLSEKGYSVAYQRVTSFCPHL